MMKSALTTLMLCSLLTRLTPRGKHLNVVPTAEAVKPVTTGFEVCDAEAAGTTAADTLFTKGDLWLWMCGHHANLHGGALIGAGFTCFRPKGMKT